MIRENMTCIPTKDGEQIAIWRMSDKTKSNPMQKKQNVLFVHGAFSDKRVSKGIAGYLTKSGYDCYVMEWRGRGDSSKPKKAFNFETVALNDVAAVVQYLIYEKKLSNLHCIGHSGGGLCLTMFLAKNKRYIDKINSISMFASQAYGAILTPKCYAKIVALSSATRVLGYLPAKRFKVGPFNESHYTMKQWYKWNLRRNYLSGLPEHKEDPFDYRDHMADITIPIYAISAKGDTFIAPSNGCEQYLNDFKNPANQFREFSIAKGDLSDYGHTKILISLNAAKEVWPTVQQWIEKHSGN